MTQGGRGSGGSEARPSFSPQEQPRNVSFLFGLTSEHLQAGDCSGFRVSVLGLDGEELPSGATDLEMFDPGLGGEGKAGVAEGTLKSVSAVTKFQQLGCRGPGLMSNMSHF